MKLPSPLPDSATPLQVREHRIHTVLLWLSEFQISSVPILAQLVGLQPEFTANTHTFFRSLERDGFITLGKHPMVKSEHLVVAAPGAAHFLFIRGYVQSLYTDGGLISRSRNIFHDLSIQRVIAARLPDCAEIQGEYQLRLNTKMERYNRPDALITSHNGQRIAYEYESSLKSRGRVYLGLQSHILAIDAKLYDAVVYFFPSRELKEKYENFKRPAVWPLYEKEKEHGSVRRLNGTFDPKANIKNIHFTVESYYHDPHNIRS